MSKINEIQQRLSEIDGTRFHRLVDTYLNKKYQYNIHSTGTKMGEDKPRKGTPDTLIKLENGQYIFVEYTTRKTDIRKKLLDDIKKCLDPEKTNIQINKIDKIILASNSSFQSTDIEEFQKACGSIECEILSNSTLSYDLNNNYSILVKDFLGIDVGIVLTPTILQKYYLNNFDTISLLITNTPKSIEDIFINLLIQEEEKEKEKKYSTVRKIPQTIEIETLLKESNKSLIYGKAGIGKTTLCKYIAYMWSIGRVYQEFEYVVYLPLRRWRDNQGLKSLIRDVYFTLDNQMIEFNIIKNSKKTLFLFDGYDELIDKEILHDTINKNNIKHYVITSRPMKCDIAIDKKFETMGFTADNIDKYINNFFEDNHQQSKSLQRFIGANTQIREISKSPLILEILCSLWKEGKSHHPIFNTTTDLYKEIINLLLKEHHHKNRNDKHIYEPDKRDKIKFYLTKIAFKGLENQVFRFDYSFFKEMINTEEDKSFLENSILNSGFLLSDKSDNILLDNKFEFIHLIFQEYFSALYISQLSKGKQREVIKKYRFYPNFQVVFFFLSSLVDDKQVLLNEIESDPRDFVGLHELNLILTCLQEIKKEDIDGVWLKEKNELIVKWLTYLLKNKSKEKYDKLLNDASMLDYLNVNSFSNSFLNSNIQKTTINSNSQENDYELIYTFFESTDFIERRNLAQILENDKYFDYFSDLLWNGYQWDRLNKITFQYLLKFIKKNYAHSQALLFNVKPVDCRDKQILKIAIEQVEKCFYSTDFSNLEKNIQCDIVLDIVEHSDNEKLKIDAILQLIRTNVAPYTDNGEGEIHESLKILGKGNQEVIDTLFEAFQNIEIDWYNAMESADALSVLDPSNPKLISLLFQTFNDKNLNIRARVVSAELLSTLSCNKSRLLKEILKFSYEEEIDIKEKIHLLKFIFQHTKIYQQEILNRLKEILLDDETLDLETRIEISHFLIFKLYQHIMFDEKVEMMNSLDSQSHQQLKELIKYVNNEKISLVIREEIAIALGKLQVNNKEIWVFCIKKLRANSIDNYYTKEELLDGLIFLSKSDNSLKKEFLNLLYWLLDTEVEKHIKMKAIDTLVIFALEDKKVLKKFLELVNKNNFEENINNYVKSALVDMVSDDFEIFKDAYVVVPKYKIAFYSNVNMKVLFKAYDEKYFDIDDVFKRIFYLPETVYIKNKRLCTIENNDEICTKRKINVDRLKFHKNVQLQIDEEYNQCNTYLRTKILCVIVYTATLTGYLLFGYIGYLHFISN